MTRAILVTDKVYPKTERYIRKLRELTGEKPYVALVDGFSPGLHQGAIRSSIESILAGSIEKLAQDVRQIPGARIVALNQSGVLPCLAIERLLYGSFRAGMYASCDKIAFRKMLKDTHPVEFRAHTYQKRAERFSASRYVVKPAFGMSSAHVRIFDDWDAATAHADRLLSHFWVPSDVMALVSNSMTSNEVLIESYIPGTEFSIDGWVDDENMKFVAIVQHKLSLIVKTFIGDGPTVSPPMTHSDVHGRSWSGLKNNETDIIKFGRSVLVAIGFCKGVFHIEAKEQPDGRLCVIEVNPRAPGGALWETAQFRCGYDLEMADAALQLELRPPTSLVGTGYALHLPFYASHAGTLENFGALLDVANTEHVKIEFVSALKQVFSESDLLEEPYLAFLVAFQPSAIAILDKIDLLLAIRAPEIVHSLAPAANVTGEEL